MRPEQSVYRDIERRLDRMAPEVRYKKLQGLVTSRNEPDYMIVTRGRLLMVEVKRDGKAHTIRQGQLLRLRWWQEAGAEVLVTDSGQAVEDYIRSMQTRHDNEERKFEEIYG